MLLHLLYCRALMLYSYNEEGVEESLLSYHHVDKLTR